MRQLAVTDLALWLAEPTRERPVLLDVREPWELATCALPGSLSIPMGQIPARWQEIDTGKPVVCICHHGVRSLQVMRFLAHQGLQDLYNLAGGIDAWAREIDPAMAVY